MTREKEYIVAQKYIPAVIALLEQTGHFVENCGNDVTIFYENVMQGFIDSTGNVTIATDNDNVLSELERYQKTNTEYGA